MIDHRTVTTYTVKCDRCPNRSRSVAQGLNDSAAAMREAMTKGWVLGIEDVCPRCVADGRVRVFQSDGQWHYRCTYCNLHKAESTWLAAMTGSFIHARRNCG